MSLSLTIAFAVWMAALFAAYFLVLRYRRERIGLVPVATISMSLITIVFAIDWSSGWSAPLAVDSGNWGDSHDYLALTISLLSLVSLVGLARSFRAAHKTKEALKRSEAHYRMLVGTMNDGVRVIENGVHTYVNQRYCQLTGYERAELLGQPADLVFDETNRAIESREASRRHSGENTSCELVVTRSDGELVPVIVSSQPLYDEEGNVLGNCGVFTDIAERKSHEGALRESEQRFRDFAEPASDRFWEQNSQLRFTFFTDPEGREGPPIPQIALGKTRWELAGIDPESDENWRQHKSDLDARRAFRDFRFSCPDINGVIHHWKVSGKPIFGKDGEFKGYRGAATEVTAEVQAQELAAKARTRLVYALENISEGFAFWDPDDRLVLCNEQYRNIYPDVIDILTPGITFEEVLRTAAERGMYNEALGDIEAMIQARLKKHRDPDPKPFVQALKDNRWVQIRERRTADGGVVGIWTDITELKRREQELLQAQKMEAVGQLTGGVAHDFNNLLAVILGNLELLDDCLGSDETQKKHAQAAITAARRGSALTQRLLAFSRKQALQPRATNIQELVLGMTELIRSTIGKKIEIQSSFESDLPLANIDPHQLESALLNLTLNSRDAMNSGGRLLITGKTSGSPAKSSENDKEFVVITVSDNGCGMSSEVRQRACEPFFTTKDVGRGSGLGLSMVYGFVKQSGGHVRIESTPNQGTSVILYLPVATASDTRAEEPAAMSIPEANGETILVVEDDPHVRDLTVTILSNLEYEVIEAKDGESALYELEKSPNIDLLFTDVVLPGGMSGPELADEARRRRTDLRVLFMSGYTQHVIVRPDSFGGNVNLLNKPFRKADLARKVREVLQ